MTRVYRFLEMLVRFAEDNVGVGVPLTLTVGGLLVSGTIISQKRYLTSSPMGSVRDCRPSSIRRLAIR